MRLLLAPLKITHLRGAQPSDRFVFDIPLAEYISTRAASLQNILDKALALCAGEMLGAGGTAALVGMIQVKVLLSSWIRRQLRACQPRLSFLAAHTLRHEYEYLPPEVLEQHIQSISLCYIKTLIGTPIIACVHLQDRLSTMIGKSSGFLETLPPQMRARIEFLRELQDKHDDFFEEYQKELKAIREKYEAKYGRLPHRVLAPRLIIFAVYSPSSTAVVHNLPVSSSHAAPA